MTRTRSAAALNPRLRAIGALVLFTLAACSGSKAATEPVTASTSQPARSTKTEQTPTVVTASSSTTADPQNHLVAAVRSFWNLYVGLGAHTGKFNAAETRARLAQRTTGKELTQLLAVFQGNAAAGLVVKGTIDIAPKVMSIVGATALVQDCYDDETGLYSVNDGQRLDVNDPRRHKALMTLTHASGVWKVSVIRDEGLGCTA